VIDSNDIPIYEPQDAGGPPPEGPTEGQFLVSLGWQPGEDLGYPNFTATVIVDPNLDGNGPNDDFIFPAGEPEPQTGPPNQPFGFVELTFTEADWNIPKPVIVEAVEDLLREGNESFAVDFTVTIDIADCNFGYTESPCDPCNIVTRTVGVFVVDNDIPYISVLPPGYIEDVLSENNPGAPRCVNVTLSHKPTSNVEVRAFIESEYDLLANSMVVMDPNLLHFTPGNYNVNQTICLEALDDDDYPDSEEE
jgi:hypothetical protein